MLTINRNKLKDAPKDAKYVWKTDSIEIYYKRSIGKFFKMFDESKSDWSLSRFSMVDLNDGRSFYAIVDEN